MDQGDKRKERWDKILCQLEQGVESLFNSTEYKRYLDTMAKFTKYSLNNSILIYSQKPDATYVAGYRAWQKNFNRHVKKGEKGITILVPYIYKEKEKTADENGEKETEKTEEKEISHIYFRPATVFDISQTEGEPLPQWANCSFELTGQVKGYEDFFQILKEISSFPITFETISGHGKGYCSPSQEIIVLKDGMSQVQNVKTAVHEITHAHLHSFYGKQTDAGLKKPREICEVEAESVAYVVCRHYGIDSSEYSFPYIAGWERRDRKILRESLETIRGAAETLINKIDEAYLKWYNREITLESVNEERISKESAVYRKKTYRDRRPTI